MDLFRVRLNCVDHYQATPTELDPNLFAEYDAVPQRQRPRVPVIRVFGATQTGQKVCAHIHGALPYLFVEYTGSLDPADVDAFSSRLHLSIDHALAVSYRQNLYEGRTRYVARITLVKGVPFFGYHVGYKFFLKIYVLNPLHMTRLADLLRQGTIMNRVFLPYESHLQYLLQWMCDFNLYGCAYVDCQNVAFRAPVPPYDEKRSALHFWHERSISPASILNEDRYPRQSHCSIEIDVHVKDILNRNEVHPRPIHQDFIERTKPLSLEDKLVQSMAGLWKDETRRRKARMSNPEPGSSPFPPEVMISMSADPRSSENGGWIHEEDFVEQIRELIRHEREDVKGRRVTYDNFVQKTPFEDNVQTTLESVEDLFPERLQRIDPMASQDKTDSEAEYGSFLDDVVVDEVGARGLADDQDDGFESDEDIARELEMTQRATERSDPATKQETRGAGSKKDEIDEHQEIDNAPHDEERIQTPSSSAFEADMEAFEMDLTSPLKSLSQARSSADSRNNATTSDKEKKGTSQGTKRRRGSSSQFDRRRSDSQQLHAHFAEEDMTGIDASDRATLDSGSQRSQTDRFHSGKRQSKTLNFPIVKDPQDPNTIFRLSQRSASSQHSSKLKPSQDDTSKSFTSSEILDDSVSEASKNPDNWSAQVQSVANNVADAFGQPGNNSTVLCFHEQAPLSQDIESSFLDFGLPPVVHQDAYYGDEKDVPERLREYAGREFRLESKTVPYLPEFNSEASLSQGKPRSGRDKVAEDRKFRQAQRSCGLRSWEIGDSPPSAEEVSKWLSQQPRVDEADSQQSSQDSRQPELAFQGPRSQIEGPTQLRRHGFKFSQKQKSTSVQHEAQYMSLMSLEVHVNTRGKFLPNPEEDEVACIFWALQSDDDVIQSADLNDVRMGVVVLSSNTEIVQQVQQLTKMPKLEFHEEESELDLITHIVDIVRSYDPDILTGYEVHNGSWGYLIERARVKYDFNLCDEFSRMKSQSHGRFGKDNDRWGFNHTSTIRVTGRHMINIWRAMRSELNLLQYTLENVTFHLLHRRVPHYHFSDLSRWYTSGKPKDIAKVIDYYLSRVKIDLEILEQNELVPRTSEQARLLGVDFFSVFSRGSQFKVESLMFRIAKPETFLLPSPGRKQVGQQNALECLPLVMEPQSDFYSSPMLVLDFQSLYPSVMIAYNYCYSTFLGRIVDWRGQNKMGFTDFKRQEMLLDLLKDDINISPNGMMYVKPEIRKSLLAKMLAEILETRVMVKSGMKEDKDDKALQRLLNNRQLALKLIANVTYGYTSASFSGRMPCSEIADSIVQTGRETLEKAIALIHSRSSWGAEVVYGDTDSLFVYLKGRSKAEAFEIGQDIANTITKMNPRPIKLKFEKVYFPCVLLAKKRYVGFKYESPSQREPEFDAKGIETVRRDGTPAEQKIEEKALKILFRTADLSEVKKYFQQQCTKIMKSKVSVQDFCFAKEVKLGTYSDRGLPPPGAMISTRKMLQDPRSEPQYGERVPYVVVTGGPSARLIDRCVAPEELLLNEYQELDAEYYISKNLIPPLERIFNLVGANVRGWYDEIPKFQRIRRADTSGANGKETTFGKRTLESYMRSSLCAVCRAKIEKEAPICDDCLAKHVKSLLVLRGRLFRKEKKTIDVHKVCRSCAGLAFGEEVRCDSKDCPVFYTRLKQDSNLRSTRAAVQPVMGLLEEARNTAYEW